MHLKIKLKIINKNKIHKMNSSEFIMYQLTAVALRITNIKVWKRY